MRWGLIIYWLAVSMFSVFAFLSLTFIYLVLNMPVLLMAAGAYGSLAMNALYNAFREAISEV